MVAVVLGLAARRRPTTPPTRSRSRSAWPTRERPGRAVDAGPGGARCWIAAAVRPITRGGDAVRAGRARGARAGEATEAPRRGDPRRSRPVIASVEGVVGGGRRPTRWSSRSAASATGCSPRRRCSRPPARARRLKLHTYHLVREDQQALFGFRTPEELGFFTLLLTVTGVGPKVAMAIVGSRPTAGPPARDHAAGPGGARVDPGDRQEARRADHLRAQGEGGRGRGRGAGSAARCGAAWPRARSSPRSRRSATRWRRRARRRGRARGPGAVGAGLEERVKAALRTLLRD